MQGGKRRTRAEYEQAGDNNDAMDVDVPEPSAVLSQTLKQREEQKRVNALNAAITSLEFDALEQLLEQPAYQKTALDTIELSRALGDAIADADSEDSTRRLLGLWKRAMKKAYPIRYLHTAGEILTGVLIGAMDTKSTDDAGRFVVLVMGIMTHAYGTDTDTTMTACLYAYAVVGWPLTNLPFPLTYPADDSVKYLLRLFLDADKLRAYRDTFLALAKLDAVRLTKGDSFDSYIVNQLIKKHEATVSTDTASATRSNDQSVGSALDLTVRIFHLHNPDNASLFIDVAIKEDAVDAFRVCRAIITAPNVLDYVDDMVKYDAVRIYTHYIVEGPTVLNRNETPEENSVMRDNNLRSIIKTCIKRDAPRLFGVALRAITAPEMTMYHEVFKLILHGYYLKDVAPFLKEMESRAWTDAMILYEWTYAFDYLEDATDFGNEVQQNRRGAEKYKSYKAVMFHLKQLSLRLTVEDIAAYLLRRAQGDRGAAPESLLFTALLKDVSFQPRGSLSNDGLSASLKREYEKVMATAFAKAREERPTYVATMEEFGCWIDGVTTAAGFRDTGSGLFAATDAVISHFARGNHALNQKPDKDDLLPSFNGAIAYDILVSLVNRYKGGTSLFALGGDGPSRTTSTTPLGRCDKDQIVILEYVRLMLPYQRLRLGQLILRVLEQAVTRNSRLSDNSLRRLNHAVLDFVHAPLYRQVDTRHGWYRRQQAETVLPPLLTAMCPKEIGDSIVGNMYLGGVDMVFSAPLAWLKSAGYNASFRSVYQRLNEYLLPESLPGAPDPDTPIDMRHYFFSDIEFNWSAILCKRPLGPWPMEAEEGDDDDNTDARRKRGRTEGTGINTDTMVPVHMADLAFQHHLSALGNVDARPCLVEIRRLDFTGTVTGGIERVAALFWFLMRTCRVWARPLFIRQAVLQPLFQAYGMDTTSDALSQLFAESMPVEERIGAQVVPYFHRQNLYHIPGMQDGDFLWVPKPRPAAYHVPVDALDPPVLNPTHLNLSAAPMMEPDGPVPLLETYTRDSRGEKVNPKDDIWSRPRGPVVYTMFDGDDDD